MRKKGQIGIITLIIVAALILGLIIGIFIMYLNRPKFDCGIGVLDNEDKVCIYNLTSDQLNSVVKCPPEFNLDETEGTCEKIVESVYVCNTAEGTYDSSIGICRVSVQNTQYICQAGTYDYLTGACNVLIENITYSCSEGAIQEINGIKSCVVSLKTIKGQMVYCGNGECDDKERTQGICPEDCKSNEETSDVPYSFLAVHFEIDPNNKEAADRWQNMVTMVDLANQYNVPLTIMFWPGSAEYALSSPERIAKVREWQTQGHEIGIHNQGCYDAENTNSAAFHQESDNALYEQLAGEYTIKSGTTVCEFNLISTYKYEGGGRPDGRSAMAIKHSLASGQEVYGLNIKAGYANGTQIKIAQYNTLSKDEIYGFANHGEGDAGNIGGTVELKEWLNFLYGKDPGGEKRMTLSNIMEQYVLPNNLVASMDDFCSSTDLLTQQCLSLAKFQTKPGSTNCIVPYDNGAFNFGRCLQTGTYCGLEEGLSEEQLCSISLGDYYTYVPTSCLIKNISEYEPVEPCVNENKTSGTGDKTNPYCPDGECDEKELAQGICPEDCGGVNKTSSDSCGDGYCDGPAGEKTSCPGDCVVNK